MIDSLLPPDFPWRPFIALLSFVLGACVGSFLNVCVYRIPRDLSVVAPRSFCPACSRQIPWYLNVPLLSWVMLRGRCRWCGARISPRYVIVELLVACLFLLVWLKHDLGASPRLLGLSPITDWRIVPVYWLAVSGLVLGTFVDFEHLIIPDRVTLGGIVAGLLLSGFLPSMHEETTVLRSLLWSSVGAGIGWGVLWATAALGQLAFKKEAMGFGDVKLMGAIGAFLGARAVFFTIMCSSLLGSVVGISLVMFGRKQMQSRIPYGPYLALAALLWMLWGPYFWNLYVSMVTPNVSVY